MADDISALSDEELLDEQQQMHELIFGYYACFSSNDVRYYWDLMQEVESRNIDESDVQTNATVWVPEADEVA